MEIYDVTKTNLDILCFGDSLTEGWLGGGMSMHPYAINLRKCLHEKLTLRFSKSFILNVEEHGISGEQVGEMSIRIGKLLKRKEFFGHSKETSKHYSHVIILGGTNDLGTSRSPEEIFKDIKSLHLQAHKYGSKTIAVTIPEAFFRAKDYIKKRTTINNLIKEFAYSKRDSVLFLNLEKEIPFDLSNTEEFWSDVLHLNRNGYDRFGELLCDVILDDI